MSLTDGDSLKNVIWFYGWRPGRNPPSVLSSIHLIGVPAPHAVFIGAYYPFHGVGRLFHPHKAAQRFRIIVISIARFVF